MNRILSLVGMTVASWVGWKLGALVSFGAAFVLSLVASALGLWWTRRWVRENLP